MSSGTHLRQLTFHEYDDPPATSQSEAFRHVQEGMYAKHATQAALLQQTMLRLAAERGREGFTAREALEAAGGPEGFPRNLVGAVVGSLRSCHAICVVGRERGTSPRGKGRWVNRFALNGDALEVGR